ncbi:hypothetical protein BsWGS_01938 [Bradybaena similaris]
MGSALLLLLQAEINRLNLQHDAEVARLTQTMNQQMEDLSRELNQKWTESMKSENSKLWQELTDQSQSEKRTALLELSRQKDEEIAATRAEHEAELECLKSQIEELQSSLDSAKLEGDVEKAKLKYELERERSRLSKDMLEATNEYSNKMVAMEKLHMNEKEHLRAQSEQEKNDLEAMLKQLHMQELQSQMTAHKAVLENAIKLEHRQKQEALDALRSKCQSDAEALQSKLEQKHKTEIDALKQAHSNEIRVAKMELDRAVEISKQKVKDHLMQLEELQGEIVSREQHIRNLKDHVVQLEEEISRLKKEIDAKALEVQQAHKQASQQLRLQEDKLTRQSQTTVDNLTTDHLREKQGMLTQFGSAQDLLKEKISSLQIELEEAHQRYLHRESRREDLEMIETLRCAVSERETRIKDLIDEKRFYQLELVNRETNFNKVFNANPNVGILNPFLKPKKKGDKPGKLPAGSSSTMGSGSSSGHQRLDPLPGSPLHDGLLNPTKPLPQPSFTKKVAN